MPPRSRTNTQRTVMTYRLTVPTSIVHTARLWFIRCIRWRILMILDCCPSCQAKMMTSSPALTWLVFDWEQKLQCNWYCAWLVGVAGCSRRLGHLGPRAPPALPFSIFAGNGNFSSCLCPLPMRSIALPLVRFLLSSLLSFVHLRGNWAQMIQESGGSKKSKRS